MKKISLVIILCVVSLLGQAAVADLGAIGSALQGYLDGTQQREARDRANRQQDVQIARDRGYAYDSKSGNSYSSYGNGYSGYNGNTGSRWNSNSYGGSTYGRDSKGNSWSYDQGTGIYQNYGTGERRYRGQRQ